MQTAHAVLAAVRVLLSSKMRWARGAPAYDLRNNEVSPEGPLAARWSLLGALAKASRDEAAYCRARKALLTELHKREPRQDLHRFNETASHQDLLELLDAAIAVAAERELGFGSSGPGRSE